MKTAETHVLDILDVENAARVLSELVAVPSHVGHEDRLAVLLGDMLEAEGFDVEFQNVEGSRRNVIATYRFPAPGPCLMFNGHLDTVAPRDDWDGDPHEAVQKNGRIYGLGAVDMKGGIAASIVALKALVRSKDVLCGSIMFSGVVDEEGYSKGARALLDYGLDHVDAIVIGEPCGGTKTSPVPIHTAGKVLYRLTTHGVQAHGFMPRQGINAIEEAARTLSGLDQLQQVEDPQLGTGPVSTLKISGGYEEYAVVVPDRCEAIISRMIVPGETSESCRQDMENLIDRLDLDARVVVDMIPPYYAPLKTDTSHDMFRLFEDAFEQEHGVAPVLGPSVIITDASIFCGLGKIPTLVYGPTGGGIHQANEYVDLGLLAACTNTYARIASRFLTECTTRRSK